MATAAAALLAFVGAPETAVASPQSSWSVDGGYAAWKDELNVGLVFHGAELGGQYAQRYDVGPDAFSWAVAAELGMTGTRGLLALDLELHPIDVGYAFRIIDTDRWTTWLGPGLTGNYRWFVNPELHSGHFFWYAHYDLEARAASTFKWRGHDLRVELRAAALSLASRPTSHPDPYFYEWGIGDLLARTHRNLTAGSVNRVQHVDLQFEWFWSGSARRRSLSYGLVFDNYRPAPAFSAVTHAVRFTWY